MSRRDKTMRRAGRIQRGSKNLLILGNGTFTRSSTATYQEGAAVVRSAAVNELRQEDRGDGNGNQYLLEGARTNLALQSEALTTTPWAGGSITVNDATAPDGTVTADLLEMTAGEAGVFQSPTQAGEVRAMSYWAKAQDAPEVGEDIRMRYGTSTVDSGESWGRVEQTLAAAWARSTGITTIGSGGANNPDMEFDHRANLPESGVDAELGAVDFHAWGIQMEASNFPTSYIPTTTGTATRAADALTFASMPPWFLSGKWAIDIFPYAASTDTRANNQQIFNKDDADNYLRINTDDTFSIKMAGTIGVTDALTWSRHQKLTITVDLLAGTIDITGQTAGTGSDTFTAGSAFDDGTYRFGARASDGAAPYWGRVSNVRQL